MSPSVLAEVRRVLHINPIESFYLNLGNDRANVTQECRIIPNITDTSALDFIYEGAKSEDDLPRTLIFVNKVLDSQLVWRRSQQILPTNLQQSVDYLNARRSSRSKKLVLKRFQDGQTRVLIVTEIGGMVRLHLVYWYQQQRTKEIIRGWTYRILLLPFNSVCRSL